MAALVALWRVDSQSVEQLGLLVVVSAVGNQALQERGEGIVVKHFERFPIPGLSHNF